MSLINHPFATCFCKSKNLLSQWRGYANRGGGYCLGFQFSSLTRFKSDINRLNDATLPYLRRVFYEPDEQEELVRSYITGISQSVEPAIGSRSVPADLDLNQHLEMMAMRAVNLLFDMIITFKIDAFKEEDEWRFIRITTEGHEPEFLSFREDSGSIVPSRPTYIYNSNGTDDYHFPLASVGFGPTLDATASKSSIQLYLNHIATDDHRIKLSPNISIIDPGYRLR